MSFVPCGLYAGVHSGSCFYGGSGARVMSLLEPSPQMRRLVSFVWRL